MAEKKILIPARLKSGVVDGHVTGAADIIDDVVGKTQDVINSEVSQDIADLRQETSEAIASERQRAEGVEATLQSNINAENTRATGAEATLQANITSEENRAKAVELNLSGSISAEETRAKAAEQVNANDISTINSKIPSQATTENQLADKAFVNSSIETSTATFRGTYNTLEELQQVTADNNDYGFVVSTDASGNTVYNRYKYDGTAWLFEYALNNSSFTAEQWATINSALTSSHKTKLDELPDNDELVVLLGTKQDNISDLEAIRQGAASGATAYQKPSEGIVKSDLDSNVQASLNKADTALQEHQDISSKADKDNTVSQVKYNGTTKKLTQTINEIVYDIITLAQLKQDMGLENVADIDQSKAVRSFVVNGHTVTYTCLDSTTGTFELPQYTDFKPSGSEAASGLVPKPSTTAGTDKYLCEDGTWKKPYESSYELPIASASTLGGVKIGDGLTIDSNTGVLSATSVDSVLDNVYIGMGATYSDAMVPANLHSSLKKGEAVSVTSASDDYLWIILPKAYSVTPLMEGIRIPATKEADITEDSIIYQAFKSKNTYEGTFGIMLI